MPNPSKPSPSPSSPGATADAPTVVGELDDGCSSIGSQLVLFTLGALLPQPRRRKEERRTWPVN